ncbi:hypothetical protein Micbo1qcDRAFT_171229 [Microdochium bolleyi]|uniref:Uncharacterized protein n=1 Tax=Microdochium bolleyi TaxID=196109 RepID=A0A136JK88_9PEZI|nr:hypothetical protein Micbo1qcDRAFT_171229 [Microdochium bolleyi]
MRDGGKPEQGLELAKHLQDGAGVGGLAGPIKSGAAGRCGRAVARRSLPAYAWWRSRGARGGSGEMDDAMETEREEVEVWPVRRCSSGGAGKVDGRPRRSARRLSSRPRAVRGVGGSAAAPTGRANQHIGCLPLACLFRAASRPARAGSVRAGARPQPGLGLSKLDSQYHWKTDIRRTDKARQDRAAKSLLLLGVVGRGGTDSIANLKKKSRNEIITRLQAGAHRGTLAVPIAKPPRLGSSGLDCDARPGPRGFPSR